jgi:hypothetical protein
MKATFVWMPTQKGPEPQIWFGPHKTEKEKPRPLFKVDLPEHEAKLPLGKLEKLYPCPEVTT